MRSFNDLYAIAAERKGGPEALEALLSSGGATTDVRAVPDDRWLATMTRCIFQAGFNWKVVDRMWPGFEEAFDGFNIDRCAMIEGERLDALVGDTRIVRHGPKIRAVAENAVFITELRAEHGSAGAFFADWPAEDYVGLLEALKKRGTRLGGTTGMYFLRFSGVDSFILSRDVTARLIAEGIVDKAPSSKTAMRAVQDAFNTWSAESGRSLTEISRVLALSTG